MALAPCPKSTVPVGSSELKDPQKSQVSAQAGTKRASNKHPKNKVNLVCRVCKATCLGCKTMLNHKHIQCAHDF